MEEMQTNSEQPSSAPTKKSDLVWKLLTVVFALATVVFVALYSIAMYHQSSDSDVIPVGVLEDSQALDAEEDNGDFVNDEPVSPLAERELAGVQQGTLGDYFAEVNFDGFFDASTTKDTYLEKTYARAGEDANCYAFGYGEGADRYREALQLIDARGDHAGMAQVLTAVTADGNGRLSRLCNFNGETIAFTFDRNGITNFDVRISGVGNERLEWTVSLYTLDEYYQVYTQFSNQYLLLRNGYGDAGWSQHNYYLLDTKNRTLDLIESCSSLAEDIGTSNDNHKLECSRYYKMID